MRLPSMVSDAGLTVLESNCVFGPLGRLCRTRTFNRESKSDLSQYEAFSVESFMFVLKHLANSLFVESELYAADGVSVGTEDGMQTMLNAVEAGLRADGAVSIWGYVFATKAGRT